MARLTVVISLLALLGCAGTEVPPEDGGVDAADAMDASDSAVAVDSTVAVDSEPDFGVPSECGMPCGDGPCDIGFIECVGAAAKCWLQGPAPAGTICRPSVGFCDIEDVCDGIARTCPADATMPDGAPCPTSGVCRGPYCAVE